MDSFVVSSAWGDSLPSRRCRQIGALPLASIVPGVPHLFVITGCRARPERSRRRSPLPKEVWNPRWVPLSI